MIFGVIGGINKKNPDFMRFPKDTAGVIKGEFITRKSPRGKQKKSHMYAVLKQLSPLSPVFAGRQSFDVKRYLFMPEITFPMMKSTADRHAKISTKELINITPSLNK